MTKRLSKSPKSASVLPTDYAPLLADIKARVQTVLKKLSQSVTESHSVGNGVKGEAAIVQVPLAQLPWHHHVALPDKLTNPSMRLN